MGRFGWNVGNVVNDIGNKAGGIVHDAGNQVGNVANQAGNVAHDVGNQAGNIVNDIGHHATEIGNQAGNTVHDIGNKAGEVVHDIEKKANDVFNPTLLNDITKVALGGPFAIPGIIAEHEEADFNKKIEELNANISKFQEEVSQFQQQVELFNKKAAQVLFYVFIELNYKDPQHQQLIEGVNKIMKNVVTGLQGIALFFIGSEVGIIVAVLLGIVSDIIGIVDLVKIRKAIAEKQPILDENQRKLEAAKVVLANQKAELQKDVDLLYDLFKQMDANLERDTVGDNQKTVEGISKIIDNITTRKEKLWISDLYDEVKRVYLDTNSKDQFLVEAKKNEEITDKADENTLQRYYDYFKHLEESNVIKRPSAVPPPVASTSSAYRFLPKQLDWKKVNGGLKCVSVGNDGTVWGVSASNDIWNYLGNNNWQQIGGKLKQISCADKNNVWGVSPIDEIFTYQQNPPGWIKISGALKWVSVGSDGTVWGVNVNDDIFKYLGNNNWQHIEGKLKQISCGDKNNVWGVNAAGVLFTFKQDAGWIQIKSVEMKNITCAAGNVTWAISTSNKVYYYLFADNWQEFNGSFKQISANTKNTVWGVTENDEIFTY